MNQERNRLLSTDTLLDTISHSVGTRLLLTRNSQLSRIEPYEATVVEWSPSGRRVKLQTDFNDKPHWIECWDYSPVVLEVLPTITKEDDHG